VLFFIPLLSHAKVNHKNFESQYLRGKIIIFFYPLLIYYRDEVLLNSENGQFLWEKRLDYSFALIELRAVSKRVSVFSNFVCAIFRRSWERSFIMVWVTSLSVRDNGMKRHETSFHV